MTIPVRLTWFEINRLNQKNINIKSDIFTTLYLYNQKYSQNKKKLERKIYDYKIIYIRNNPFTVLINTGGAKNEKNLSTKKETKK